MAEKIVQYEEQCSKGGEEQARSLFGREVMEDRVAAGSYYVGEEKINHQEV